MIPGEYINYFDFPMIVNGLLLSGGILVAIFLVRRLHGMQLQRGLSLVTNHSDKTSEIPEAH